MPAPPPESEPATVSALGTRIVGSIRVARSGDKQPPARAGRTLTAPVRRRSVSVMTGRPPIVLVHGAANSSGVWRFWQVHLTARGWSSHALDLRGHGDGEAVDLSD